METLIGIDLNIAIENLKKGEPIGIPTETVYGLAADIKKPEAIAKIFEVKNRPSFDPLIVHLLDKEQLIEICQSIPEAFDLLYNAFCPGPITFILLKKEGVSDLITAGHPTVGIRFPNHPLTRQLLKLSKLALAAPSANPFGYVSPTSAQHVNNQLGGKISYILDGGECKVGLESTIIDLSKNEITILRLGGLSLEEIEDVLGYKIRAAKTSSSNPKAPGMLSSHYSPSKKVIFDKNDKEEILEDIDKIGSIRFNTYHPIIEKKNQWLLSEKGDLKEAARNLFKVLRETENTDLEYIYAEKFPDVGLGKAINDRLKRAAH